MFMVEDYYKNHPEFEPNPVTAREISDLALRARAFIAKKNDSDLKHWRRDDIGSFRQLLDLATIGSTREIKYLEASQQISDGLLWVLAPEAIAATGIMTISHLAKQRGDQGDITMQYVLTIDEFELKSVRPVDEPGTDVVALDQDAWLGDDLPSSAEADAAAEDLHRMVESDRLTRDKFALIQQWLDEAIELVS